jgi:tetratricopeptide (TPR) repeat protein
VLESTLESLPDSAEYAVLRARLQAAAAPLLRRTGQFERAQAYVQQSISLARHHGLPGLQAQAMLQLSDVLLVHGQIQQARCEVEIALSLAQRNGQRRLEAEALLRLDFGLTQSDTHLQQALARARELADCELQSRIVSALGAYAIGTGQYGRARDFYQQALAYAERMESQNRVLSLCNTLGDISRLIGAYATAQAMYDRALALAHRLGDMQIEAHSLEGRSRLWLVQGQIDQAREDIQRCIERCHKLKLWMVLAYALNSLGFIELALANSPAAATCFEQSVAISGRHQLDSVITESYAGLAAAARDRGRPATALRYATSVLERIAAGHLDYYADPARVYLICHQALAAAADPRATSVLDSGVELVRRQAATMQSNPERDDFYAAAFNRDLMALANAVQLEDSQRSSG